LKVAVGNTHSRTLINGSTTITPPDATATTSQGGFLALPTNMGDHETNQFSVVPELGLTAGYALLPRLRATFGYTFMYWGNVVRSGNQIDLSVDPRQLPPATNANSLRPEFQRHVSDFWAQGMNIGLDLRF
jgi:hypothetical protein